jgi:hypothetical protein
MKIHHILPILTVIMSSAFGQISTKEEAAFLDQIQDIVKSGSLKSLSEIYQPGDSPQREVLEVNQSFEALISRGLESAELIEIFPMMKESLLKPMQMDGKSFTLNVKPYKMIELKFKTKIEGGSSGFTLVVGERDGRLWIAGFNEQK